MEERLILWQERFTKAKNAYDKEREKFGKREGLYLGDKTIFGKNNTISSKKAHNVRNLCFEMIETSIDNSIPQAKVVSRRKQDEELSQNIEDMLRSEMDRLPSEKLNDMDERTTYIQGGDFFLVEWDTMQNTHTTLGALAISILHPRKVIPQENAESLDKCDWVFIELAQTKQYIKRRYGVSVKDENEDNPQVRGRDKNAGENMVTQVIVYYRNDDGTIGMFSWVNDIVLVDMKDYQAVQMKRCEDCGELVNGSLEECYCGSKRLKEVQEDYYTIDDDIVLYNEDGSVKKVIPAISPVLDEYGEQMQEIEIDELGLPVLDAMGQPVRKPMYEPTKIPYYKPKMLPLLMRKNVSVDGMFLGTSDIDMIADQQNETNKYMTKVAEKSQKGGSIVVVPRGLNWSQTDEEMQVIETDNPAQNEQIRVYNLQADASGDMQMINNNYEYARQVLGITESFQGRRDATATSGVAKEFSANQTAGRFESKRMMKRSFYAGLYELMFKFMLAYADEPRSFRAKDNLGNDVYKQFNKYDFLEQDATGQWYWNDNFLFSTDNAGNLANNREALWQETRSNFESGAFGNPADIEVQIMYWTMLQELHYPIASTVKRNLEDYRERVQQQQQQMMVQSQPMML